jgi:hypothetical protein
LLPQVSQRISPSDPATALPGVPWVNSQLGQAVLVTVIGVSRPRRKWLGGGIFLAAANRILEKP